MKLLRYENQSSLEKQILNYNLPKEQAIFTSLPKEALLECSNDKNSHPIMLVNNENELTTFFVLQEKEGVEKYSTNKQAVLLRSFSTDVKYQGKGYGKLALQLLPEYIKNKMNLFNEIVLAVNSINVLAINLYKKNGFVDTKKRIKTEYGELLVLNQKIK
ncbi:GNAT family N-acetyltransferase [Enterococcus sp. LJL99]